MPLQGDPTQVHTLSVEVHLTCVPHLQELLLQCGKIEHTGHLVLAESGKDLKILGLLPLTNIISTFIQIAPNTGESSGLAQSVHAQIRIN